MFLKVVKEGELIIKMPRKLMPDFELLAKERGFKNSREFMANFVKKQLALYYRIDKENSKLENIH